MYAGSGKKWNEKNSMHLFRRYLREIEDANWCIVLGMATISSKILSGLITELRDGMKRKTEEHLAGHARCIAVL